MKVECLFLNPNWASEIMLNLSIKLINLE
jgi:hypothetical protein